VYKIQQISMRFFFVTNNTADNCLTHHFSTRSCFMKRQHVNLSWIFISSINKLWIE